MDYVKLTPRIEIEVSDIISVHYFEYTKDFAFSGEVHDFWEFVYADKDELLLTAGGNEVLLKPKQLYLHKPMEFHNVRCNGKTAASDVIVSFSSSSPALMGIAGKVIECGAEERKLMASIIKEARGAFSTPLGDPYTLELLRKDEQDFASEQLIKNHLETLLIYLIRGNTDTSTVSDYALMSEDTDTKIGAVIKFLEDNTESRLDFSDVCEKFGVSPSYLKKLFKTNVGCGVMEFYNTCRINKAKKLIREGNMNFSEISMRLDFNSVHYFSRCFKNHTGMSPSEYKESVLSMLKFR